MSFKHLDLVIKHSQTKRPDRAIMLVLANRANDKGECWPSLPLIAKDSGVARRTVTRCLPRLEAAGELRIEHRGWTVPTRGGAQAANLYRITIAQPKGTDGQSPPLPEQVETQSPQGRDAQSPKVVTDSPKGRDGLTPNRQRIRNLNRQRTVNSTLPV